MERSHLSLRLRPFAATLSVGVLAALLSGCATAGMPRAEKAMVAPAEAPAAAESPAQQMIVSSALVSLEVADVENGAEQIIAMAKRHAGYVVSSGPTTVVRVEAGSLTAALEELAAIGRVKSREIHEQDVAKQYSDTSLRLENAKAARARYLELLAKAENVEAAVQVEKELERLNGEIALLESDLGNLAHLTQYATITVTLSRKVTPGPLGWVFYALYKAVEWLFVWE